MRADHRIRQLTAEAKVDDVAHGCAQDLRNLAGRQEFVGVGLEWHRMGVPNYTNRTVSNDGPTPGRCQDDAAGVTGQTDGEAPDMGVEQMSYRPL
jgi:hypothetical protein